MSALEQEILEKLMQLDEPARRRVIQLAEQSLVPEASNWLAETRALRAEMRAKYGKLDISIADLLDEAREERLNDLLDRH
jgi:hypothetical protein